MHGVQISGTTKWFSEIQTQDHNWQLTPSRSYTKPGGPKLILNVKQVQLLFRQALTMALYESPICEKVV